MEIKPAGIAQAGRQLQKAQRDGVAGAEVVKEPALELGRFQVTLNGLEVKVHAGIYFLGSNRWPILRIVSHQREHLLLGDTADFPTFAAAAMAGNDYNSGLGRFQKRRYKLARC